MASVYLQWEEIRSLLLQRILEVGGGARSGETPATPHTYQASKICVVSVFVIQIRLMWIIEALTFWQLLHEILWSSSMVYQTKLSFETKQINRVHALNARIVIFISTTLILETCKISNILIMVWQLNLLFPFDNWLSILRTYYTLFSRCVLYTFLHDWIKKL